MVIRGYCQWNYPRCPQTWRAAGKSPKMGTDMETSSTYYWWGIYQEAMIEFPESNENLTIFRMRISCGYVLGICNHDISWWLYSSYGYIIIMRIYIYITSLGEVGIIVGISLMGIAMMDKPHFMGWWSLDMSTILRGFHQMNGESVLDFPDFFLLGIIYN